MSTRMTVKMDGPAGRRHGGRSKFRVPVEYENRRTAIADLKVVYGGLFHQKDEDYLAALAAEGIDVTFEDTF